jgi:fibronectin type 3 domain-containing protein
LQAQIPAAVVPNGNIESSEWQVLHLKPRNLTISTDGTNITLRWQGSELAQTYKVWRANSFGEIPTLVTTTTNTTYTESITNSQAIYYVDF